MNKRTTVPDPIGKILKKLKPVKLSALYKKLKDDTLTGNDKLLLAQILKELALNPKIKAPLVVYGVDNKVNLDKKEPVKNF